MKFSVITPSFNAWPWIRACLKSVSDQRPNLEHIIQDGGSSDGTEEWLREQPNISLEAGADAGMYDAINRGLKRSNGDVFSWLNADEQYLPDALATVSRFFLTHPEIDVVFGDAILVDSQGCPLSYRRIVPPHALHTRLCHLGTMSCSAFFRRRIIDEGFFLDSKWKAIGDAVWIYNLLQQGIKIGILNEPLAVFTLTGKNLGSSKVSFTEAASWAAGLPSWKRSLRPVVQACHWVRKFTAGAYVMRDTVVSIYPPRDLPTQRMTYRKRVSFRWGNAEQSALKKKRERERPDQEEAA